MTSVTVSPITSELKNSHVGDCNAMNNHPQVVNWKIGNESPLV